MEEKLYTIAVNDILKENINSESFACPFCQMYEALENDAISFTLGPSYMEDDIRLEMDKKGFCGKHVKMLYKGQNRLGLAIMLKSQLERENKELEKITSNKPVFSLFKSKNIDSFSASKYINEREKKCYVCDRINHVFDRYVATVFYLYGKENEFRTNFSKCKGLCKEHFLLAYEKSLSELKNGELDSFIASIRNIYFNQMNEASNDLSWFVDKFDYRNADKPWGNSKDILSRLSKMLFKGLDIDN